MKLKGLWRFWFVGGEVGGSTRIRQSHLDAPVAVVLGGASTVTALDTGCLQSDHPACCRLGGTSSITWVTEPTGGTEEEGVVVHRGPGGGQQGL